MYRPARPPLDKESVKLAIIDVCAHYLGPASRRSGSRFVWACRGCGKPKFEATERKGGVAGCFNADCPVPTSTDAIGVIAFFEDLDPARDFRRILERGREILGHPKAGPGRGRAAPGPGDAGRPPTLTSSTRSTGACSPSARSPGAAWPSGRPGASRARRPSGAASDP